jgi:hypothetical protein
MANLTPNHYKIILRDISEGKGKAFEAFVPAFHAFNFGDTIEEALKTYQIYFKSEAKRREKLGIPMPKSDVAEEKIKQVPLRIPESVFEKIASMSKNSGLSFNGFVTRTLENLA